MATSPGVLQEFPDKHDSTDHQTNGTGVEPYETGCSGSGLRVSSDSLVFGGKKQSNDLRRAVEHTDRPAVVVTIRLLWVPDAEIQV